MIASKKTQNQLAQRWSELKAEQPKLRIRNAAETLGVSEAELLATKTGEGVTQLRPEFDAILGDVPTLGYVMALTRNEHVVHERKGVYENLSFHGKMGLAVGEDIDLRIFLSNWVFAFAVDEERKSLQFFNKAGTATHKIYLTGKSNEQAFYELVDKYKMEELAGVQTEALEAKKEPKPDEEIDVQSFREAWKGITDTHQFFGMLRDHEVERTQALRLAPKGYTRKVPNDTLRELFHTVSESGLPIMVFVGNGDNLQIHTGPIKKLLDYGEWFNVMDPTFNLHLREPAIAQSWIVKKPTEDGPVHALEVYDKEGNNLAMIFGKRKPGIPQLDAWTELMENYLQAKA